MRAAPIRSSVASADHAAIQTGGGMQQIEFESCGRSMRWYEWLAGLLLLGMTVGVRAEAVYKCVNAQGAITYQAISCDAQQAQSVVAIPPPPRYAPSPHYVVARQEETAAPSTRSAARERAPKETAFECRASDGRIFYRLGACPHSIAGATSASVGQGHRGKTGAARSSGGAVTVASRHVSRDEACHEIHRAGALSRDGHEFDEQVSTYEHNLGHDPCKS